MDDNDRIWYDHIQGTHVNLCLRNYFNTYDIQSRVMSGWIRHCDTQVM